MRYSRIFILFSFLALAAALFFLPAGTRARLRHFGRLFTQPAEELAGFPLRVSREALGGLPPDMSVEERDELLASKTRLQAESQLRDARVRELEAQNLSLQKLLQHVSSQHSYALVVGEVLRRPVWSEARRMVVIDRGTSAGVQPGQAVLSLEGFVGVVSEATTRQAVVELFSSASFALPCEVAGRRLTAVLENSLGDLSLTSALGADYDSAQVGDQVVTTDLGSESMQPGLLLGTITAMSRDTNGAPRYAVVPAASAETLKYLMVVLPERR